MIAALLSDRLLRIHAQFSLLFNELAKKQQYLYFMDAVRKIIENYTNPLTIDLPAEFENKKIEVIVLPLEETQQNKSKFDFSDLVGKLQWKGDAIAEQRKIRDEWD